MTDTRFSDDADFAWIYNKQWGPKFSAQWLAVLDSLLLRDLPTGSHILDVCCRTGHLARMLTDRGFRVTGIDSSEHMLRYARENAPEAQFALDDVRTFTMEEMFDAALSTFDSVNQVMTLEELTAIFWHVHESLREAGAFLFDLNTEKGYREEWQDLFGSAQRDHVFVVQPTYSAEARTALFHATIFIRNGEDWRRSEAMLMQRWYPDEEVQTALAASGFEDVTVHAYSKRRGVELVTAGTSRAYYLCRKCQVVI